MARICPVEALLRYVESDIPYMDRRKIYPYLPRIKGLSHIIKKDINIKGKKIYHAREHRYVLSNGIKPASGFISCSTLRGCRNFAEHLTDPVFYTVDISKVDWYIYVPDIVTHLYKNKQRYRERIDKLIDRVDKEKEFIVQYKDELLKPAPTIRM